MSRSSIDQGPIAADLEKAESHVEVDPDVPAGARDENADDYPDGWKKITVIMIGVYLAMFLVALDRTILGTAIPNITDDFHSINDVGWYASSYLLTSCAFQLIYGRIYTFYSPKWVLLGAIFLFELGSVICGTAPTSKAFIVGRAIAGLGGAGIFSGCISIMIISIPLHKRPIFQGISGAVFGIASICGPLLGGVFTTKISWRWCFYVNIPVGAVVVIIIIFILKTPPSKNTETLRQRLWKLDPLGTVVFLPGVICLLLALQWGGTTYDWSNVRIIVLFILAALLLTLFMYIQWRGGDNATIPFHIITQRSIASGVFFSALTPGSMMVVVYFLPIWFQAIKDVSAVRSGIDTLPLVMSLVVASILAGAFTAKIGYYVPQIIACSIIMSIGAGMITTLTPESRHDKWIAYEFLFGFGLGFGMQQAGMAAQTCLAKKDVMTGVSLMFFTQGLGGAIFISIGQTVFTTSLISKFSALAASSDFSIPPSMIVNTGATDLRDLIPVQYLPQALVAYNAALSDAFKVGVGCAAATILAGATMEWKDVRKLKNASREAEKKRRETPKAKVDEADKLDADHAGMAVESSTTTQVDDSIEKI